MIVCMCNLISSNLHQGRLAQMAERSLSMREAPGSIPGLSTGCCDMYLHLKPSPEGQIVSWHGWCTWATFCPMHVFYHCRLFCHFTEKLMMWKLTYPHQYFKHSQSYYIHPGAPGHWQSQTVTVILTQTQLLSGWTAVIQQHSTQAKHEWFSIVFLNPLNIISFDVWDYSGARRRAAVPAFKFKCIACHGHMMMIIMISW